MPPGRFPSPQHTASWLCSHVGERGALLLRTCQGGEAHTGWERSPVRPPAAPGTVQPYCVQPQGPCGRRGTHRWGVWLGGRALTLYLILGLLGGLFLDCFFFLGRLLLLRFRWGHNLFRKAQQHLINPIAKIPLQHLQKQFSQHHHLVEKSPGVHEHQEKGNIQALPSQTPCHPASPASCAYFKRDPFFWPPVLHNTVEGQVYTARASHDSGL